MRVALRVEDWLLAGLAIIAGPLIRVVDGSGGVFDPGRPIEGALELIAVLGAAICLVTSRSDAPAGSSPGLTERGAVGPLAGGLLLVAVAGSTGVGLDGAPATIAWLGAIVIVVAIRLRWPALPTVVRRALVTPFILVAGSIFWGVIDGVAGGQTDLAGAATVSDLQTIGFVLGILVAFSGVYYLMLIYAPRQIAEPEGGLRTWLLRYAVFLVSVVVGVSWLRPFGA